MSKIWKFVDDTKICKNIKNERDMCVLYNVGTIQMCTSYTDMGNKKNVYTNYRRAKIERVLSGAGTRLLGIRY